MWPVSCTGSRPYTSADLDAEFAALEAQGVGVVRAWFFQSMAIRNGRLDFAGFERLIATAKAHNVRVVPVLANGQKDCEPTGTTKHLEWFAREPGFEKPLYQTVEAGYLLSYYDYAAAMAGRFANEPAVAWWELINEPHPVDNSATYHCSETIPGGIGAAQALRSFSDTAAGVIKRNDPNHLVTLGAEGEDGTCGQFGGKRYAESYCMKAHLGCSSDFEYIYSGQIRVREQTVPALDLVEIHQYGHYYCNAHSCNDEQYRRFLTELSTAELKHVEEARRLNKPIFYGELGMTPDGYRPSHSDMGGCGWADRYQPMLCGSRAACLDRKLGAAFSRSIGVSGVLYWETTPSIEARRGDCFSVHADKRNDVAGVIARHSKAFMRVPEQERNDE